MLWVAFFILPFFRVLFAKLPVQIRTLPSILVGAHRAFHSPTQSTSHTDQIVFNCEWLEVMVEGTLQFILVDHTHCHRLANLAHNSPTNILLIVPQGIAHPANVLAFEH